MGEFVDDIRAALVMNPNFCRLRFKKEETPKRNGYIKKEESVMPNNTVICSNVSVEDSNGNVCLQKKVTFKEKQKRPLLRRPASDIEIREGSARKTNCSRFYLSEQKRLGLLPKDNCKDIIGNSYKKDPIEEMNRLMGPFDDNSAEEMDFERDSKSSCSTQSKDSCDVQVQAEASVSFSDESILFKEEAVDFEMSVPRQTNDLTSFEDILAQYSTAMDESSLQALQNPTEASDVCKYRARKPFTYALISAFILVPTLLFYFLVLLYYFQPEPFYTMLLRNLKLKNEAESSSLSTIIEHFISISSELNDYISKMLEKLVSNFNDT